MNEVAILERIGQRDRNALRELYHLYSGPLYSYAMKVLGVKEDAEEVLQDVYVRIWSKAPDYNPAQSKPFTWAYMITRGLCFDRLRKRSRRPKTSAVEIDESVLGAEPSGIENLYFRETKVRIRNAMELLADKERECIELALFEENSHSAIAQRLEQPLGTVKARIRRGMLKLREILKNDEIA